jgi:hypothetical protein
MTYDLDSTLPEEFLESIAEQGLDVLPTLIQTLVNSSCYFILTAKQVG